MVRCRSWFALLLTLACPVMCHFQFMSRASTGAVEGAPHSSPCDSCPGDDSDPYKDAPCDKSCFCSPFVLHELKTDVSLSPGRSCDVALAWHGKASLVLGPLHVGPSAVVDPSPPPNQRAVGNGLPLLI